MLAKGGFYKLPLAWASDDITTYIIAMEKGIINSQIPIFQYRVNSINISSTGSLHLKMEALSLENQWYDNFLNLEVKNDLDKKYLLMIKNKYTNYKIKKKIHRIKIDLQRNTLQRIFFWCYNRKKYDVTFMMIVKGLIEALPEMLKLK